jgi:hypothetical protein
LLPAPPAHDGYRLIVRRDGDTVFVPLDSAFRIAASVDALIVGWPSILPVDGRSPP